MLERIRFERELGDLDLLREYDQGKISASAREVVVGEQIVLDINKDARFAGKKIEGIEWIVPSRTIKSYEENGIASALATELSRRDIIREKLIFYWVDAGDARQVKAKVTVDKKTTEVVVAVFDVKAPKVEAFEYKFSKPTIIEKGKNFRISFGDKTKAGVSWEASVRMPKNFGGTVKDLQTVKLGRKKITSIPSAGRKPLTFITMLPGAFQAYLLDLGNRGDGGECDQKNPTPKYQILATKAKPDESIPVSAFDTPSGDLNPFDISVSVDEYFKFFILFKPDKPNSIWVPLVKAEWFWKAEAFQKDKKWFLKSKPKPESGIIGKAEYASTAEFPFYNFNTCDNQWCEVKDGKSPECK